MDTQKKSYIWVVLLVWGLLDLLCAMLCDIHADEAYYRLYGQYLAWGYFDHPPMVGLLTALSNALVPSAGVAASGLGLVLKKLSVRLVTVLLHVATVYVIWCTIGISHSAHTASRPVLLRFLLVAASIPMFSAYGFITTPDAPLLFFAAVFYYAYRHYLDERSWTMMFLLALSMAGMLYSKYMAVLVILFAVLGNWQLLRDGKCWMAVGLTALLMIPHLWWQYSNGFPSFTYHLVSRSTEYMSLYSEEFIPNQWAVFNPLVWGLMLWAGWMQLRHGDAYGHSLGMTLIGFQVFFFLMTFRGHVEPHWTAVTSIPAILLLVENERIWNRGITIAFGVFVGIVIVARVVLMLNILPVQTGLSGQRPMCESVHAEAQERPVIFDGSFQQASLYRFYYNDAAVLVRSKGDRYTQFDLLHLERQLIGQPACVRRHGKVYMTDWLSEEDLRE